MNNTKLTLPAGIVAVMLSLTAHSDAFRHFPGDPEDQATLRAQERVEELYANGEYERSLLIYEKELAPIGDKYAQYMVGYMHLLGQGCEVNRPAALAWYRLAAERRDQAIVQARDALFKSMSQVEIIASNEVFVDLWRRLGDNHLILNLVRKDLEILSARTGSRIPGAGTSPITVVRVRPGESYGEASYDRIRDRVDRRLEFLRANVDIVDIELNDEIAVKQSLESEVREAMAALDMR